VFGARLELAERYAELLVGPGVVRGILGPREGGVIWSRHILNCAAIAPLIPPEAAVADIGSGAGLPGIAVSLVRPDLHMTLIESMGRRATFLREVADELGLAVTVHQARAEELRGKLAVDVVVARAVAPLGGLVELAAPLTRRPGALLAIKGRSARAEVHAAEHALRKLRTSADIRTVVLPGTAEATTVVHVSFP
jgi:16S rRNA (guanine527-N7)-methyltransferase